MWPGRWGERTREPSSLGGTAEGGHWLRIDRVLLSGVLGGASSCAVFLFGVAIIVVPTARGYARPTMSAGS